MATHHFISGTYIIIVSLYSYIYRLTFRTLGALRPPRRAFTDPRATRAVAGGVGASQESLSGATLAGGAQSRVEEGRSM